MTKFISKENLQTYHDLLKPEINKKLNTPESGEAGQVLTKTEDGVEWKDPYIEDKAELNIENGSSQNSLQQINCTASGYSSFAIGSGTAAEGLNSHSEGAGAKAIGPMSHAEGSMTIANGANSHSEGGGSTANGAQSHAEGGGTITYNVSEHAEGTYNESHNSEGKSYTISSIGIGTSNYDRRNAQEVMKNGDFYVYGVGGYNGTNPYESQTLQQVVNNPDISSQLGDYATKEEVAKAVEDSEAKIFGDGELAEAFDTIQEIGEYLKDHDEVAEAINEAITKKADKSELDSYLTKTEAGNTYQTKGDYLVASDIANKADKSELTKYATVESVNAKQDALPNGTVGQILTKTSNNVEWSDLNSLSTEEASSLFSDIYGEIPDVGEELPPAEEEDDFSVKNKYSIDFIDGHEVIKATINNHKYIIALADAFKTKWKSSTADISSYAPYIPTSNTGGDWTFEDGKDQLLVCNFSDYYRLDEINQQILVGSNDKNITSAATEVRKLKIGDYRWNIANFEVLNFLYENYDELFANSPIVQDSSTNNIWLPYANSSSNCWKVSITSATSTSIKCNRNGVNYEEYVIPVAVIY